MRIFVFSALLVAALVADSSAFKFPGLGGSEPSGKAKELYNDARRAYGTADYSKAIELTTKAVAEDGKFSGAYALRGKARKDMGDVDNAVKDLNKAIELDSGNGEAYYVRAQTYEIMGEMKNAKADYKKGCDSGFKEACH